MSAELTPRTFERLKLKEVPEGEIVLTEGVPAPISASSSFENTQIFFSALSFPIDRKNPPKPFGIQSEREERNWKILGRHLGTDAVLEEIGANSDYRITRERTRQIVEELVEQSYDAAPEALKEAFPRESLDTKKPWSLHKSMRKSEAEGGKLREVIEAALAGRSILEIIRETGVSRSAISRYRSLWVSIPYLKEAKTKEYQNNLRFLAERLLDDRQILAIFEDIENHNRHRVCRSLKKTGLLVPLSKAARNVGVFVHKSESMAYRLLKKLEIPVVRVESQFTDKNGAQNTRSYFFVLNNHEKTKEAFAHPSFDAFRTNPVEALGRVPDQIPTTNIMWDDAYMSVGKFLRDRRIPIPPSQVGEYLDPDCPVTVFCISRKSSKRRLYVRKEGSDALAVYLETKLAS